jgi:hypothetical protein
MVLHSTDLQVKASVMNEARSGIESFASKRQMSHPTEGGTSHPPTEVSRDLCRDHGSMARGDYGLLKVSPGPAMPYPSIPWKDISGVARGTGTCGRFLPF